MANDLTGDYDVVAAFSLGAVNRILAAMHRGNRLPHSLSMAIDDLPGCPAGRDRRLDCGRPRGSYRRRRPRQASGLCGGSHWSAQ